MTATLQLVATVLTVYWLALAGWLLNRALRARLGVAGKILLGLLPLAPGFTAVYVLILLNPAAPLRIVMWILLVGGTILAAYLTVRLFPSATPPWLAAVLGGPLRRRVTPPRTIISRMGISPGMTVVEVGAGFGHLSFDLAKLLQPGGRLICIDAKPEMIREIRTRAAASGVDNIEAHVALAGRLPAEISDVDLVLFVAVVGAVKDKPAAMSEALRVLRPGGALSIAEFTRDRHHCTPQEVKHLAMQAGFGESTTEGDALGYTIRFHKPQAAAHQPLPTSRPEGQAEQSAYPTERQDSGQDGKSVSP